MDKQIKNPLIAGLVNMLVPGSGYLYVDNDRARFLKTFIGGILLIAVMLALGNAIQNIRGYSLPQGLCIGILLLLVFVPLFVMGQKTAHVHNTGLDEATHYNAQRQTTQGTDDAQLGKIQKMRDEGLISEQEYQTKKGRLSSRK
jgi:hypothetical protein